MDQDKLIYPIDEAFRLLSLSRTAGYLAIASGELETFRDGKRRKATRNAIEKYASTKERRSEGRAAA